MKTARRRRRSIVPAAASPERSNLFGLKLRELRRAAGLYLKDVASKMGWSTNYIAQIETGLRFPPPDAAVDRLSRIVGDSMSELTACAAADLGYVLLSTSGEGAKHDLAAALRAGWKKLSAGNAETLLSIFLAMEK